MAYARRWGFGALWLVNLFAYRATHPRDLLRAESPIGPRNNHWLRRAVVAADMVVCAWGRHGVHRNRNRQVLRWCDEPRCLAQLIGGEPGHPLYRPASAEPIPYVPPVR